MMRGVRVARTKDGRYVPDTHPEAVALAYSQHDEVPDEVMSALKQAPKPRDKMARKPASKRPAEPASAEVNSVGEHRCDVCGQAARSPAGLAAHKRSHAEE